MAKRTQSIGKSKGKSKTKMGIYDTREARRVAERNGWILARKNADHFYYKKPNYPLTLVISNGLNRIVWERCVRDFGLDLNV